MNYLIGKSYSIQVQLDMQKTGIVRLILTKLLQIDLTTTYFSSVFSINDFILENISNSREIAIPSFFSETRKEINFLVHPDHPETFEIARNGLPPLSGKVEMKQLKCMLVAALAVPQSLPASVVSLLLYRSGNGARAFFPYFLVRR